MSVGTRLARKNAMKLFSPGRADAVDFSNTRAKGRLYCTMQYSTLWNFDGTLTLFEIACLLCSTLRSFAKHCSLWQLKLLMPVLHDNTVQWLRFLYLLQFSNEPPAA